MFKLNLFGNRFFAAPTDNGGFVYPGSGSAGYLQNPTGIPYYQGPSMIADIPEFQRDYNLRDALVTRIEEGRFNMMRVLFDYARNNSAYVVDDTEPRWYLDYKTNPRFYLKTMSNQGGTAGSQYATSTFTLDSVNDSKRLQSGDLILLMFSLVPTTRNSNGVIVDYVAQGAIYNKNIPIATPVPEFAVITEVNYTTGQVTVKRNAGGDKQTSTVTGPAITVVADATTDPGASSVRAADAFFIKATKPMAEGRDDVTVWSQSNTWDYNSCQFVIRKWGVTDIQNNVKKRGQPEEQMTKNRKEALEQAFEEFEYYAMFGFRKTETNSDGEWIGHAGGFFESVPSDHFVALQEPDYNSSTRAGDFTIKKFNKFLSNKFYYGSQEKVLLCGEMFHSAFSWMINNMTQNIPTIVDGWSVRGRYFECSNGGRMFITPSDSLTLNGLSHVAILLDPATFQYGHLQNMDWTVVDPLPSTNIHQKSGEIYAVFTFKRTNFDANWVFILQPNTET